MNEFDDSVERVSLVEPEDSGRSGLKKVLVIVLIVLVLGVGGFLAWKFLMTKPAEDELDSKIVDAVEEPMTPAKEAPPIGEIYIISDVLVNPARQRRIFMVSIGLEVSRNGVIDDIRAREPLLRDNLITLFSSQSQEVLTDIKYRQAFRIRVKRIMDYQLGEGAVNRVFFEKWVFQ